MLEVFCVRYIIFYLQESSIAFLSGVVSGLPKYNHLGEYTLSEILYGKVFKLIFGKWEKVLSEDI